MELDSSLAGQDLSNQDLRYRDLTGKVLFDTQFEGAEMYGVKLDMACHSFDGARFDDTHIALFLLMLSKANVRSGWVNGIKALVKSQIGKRDFDRLSRFAEIA